jgi:hypothetical protein
MVVGDFSAVTNYDRYKDVAPVEGGNYRGNTTTLFEG